MPLNQVLFVCNWLTSNAGSACLIKEPGFMFIAGSVKR